MTLVVEGARETSETLTTDADGRFASALVFPAGRIAFTAYDLDEEARIALEPREAELEFDPRARASRALAVNDMPRLARGDEVLLLATMGPTWRFRFAQEEADEDTARTLVQSEHDAGDVLARVPGAGPLPGWSGSGNPFAEWTEVRTADEPTVGHVRYPAPAELPRGGAWAEFRTEDEQWVGSVLLRGGGGEQAVVLRPSAQLTVHVAFEAEAPQADWTLRVTRAAGSGAAGTYAVADVDENGDAYLSGLDATSVRAVELLHAGEVVRTIAVSLLPGEETRVEF
ncbi:MAG: hypothetical protein IPJ77_21015 [Planctomycetes bacterium]|nr:hypothetical protein [Planctomycetota bacterium]